MKYLLITIFISSTIGLNAQTWEVGALLGTSNYSGELSPDPVQLNESQLAGGLFVRYQINKKWSVKSNIYYGSISGSDERNAKTSKNRTRNLHFRSELLEIGINGEYYLRKYDIENPRLRWAPYIFGGIAVFRFNPEAEYNGEWMPLQPLGTEGQETALYNDRERYALTQVSIPFGMGIKKALNRNWSIGLEFGSRKTFTDYLDDISTTYVEQQVLEGARGEIAYKLSNRTGEVLGETLEYTSADQRGNSTTDDWYLFTGITISYTILPDRCFVF